MIYFLGYVLIGSVVGIFIFWKEITAEEIEPGFGGAFLFVTYLWPIVVVPTIIALPFLIMRKIKRTKEKQK